jgi:zinc finger SWIM domain-containing protein 3
MDAPPSPLAIHTKFDTIQSLRDACAAYAIAHAFEYKVVKSSQSRYTIACKADGCLWRLHGSTVDGSSFCRIRTYNDQHTCFGLNHIGHAQASFAFIAKHIAAKLKEQSKYRPIDIVKDVHRELGVKVGYTKAFNAKERENELNNGTHDAAYQALPKYCADIVASNPNSVAFVEKTPDDKFKRLFICYGACATGISYCRPLIGLDGTYLKTKFQGTPFYNCLSISNRRDPSYSYRSRCERFAFPSSICGCRCRKRRQLALVSSPPSNRP